MAHRVRAGVGALVLSAVAVACGGGSVPGQASPTTSGATATTIPPATTVASTSTTVSPIPGVETYAVVASHVDGPITYPQVPPVGGAHNPVWTPCAFYDRAVPNEMAVHSLEHGVIWFTYRADLPQDQLDLLSALARSRKDILVSRWDDSLPSPLVATAWGRQLKLTTADDARVADFVRLYAHQSPEPNAPC
ncbi:MAG: DUF3105 domain-containing protein [Actinomycetota bacterium]|nr:DUF3105 domain-containing protein [Actinomycetota bacterium]